MFDPNILSEISHLKKSCILENFDFKYAGPRDGTHPVPGRKIKNGSRDRGTGTQNENPVPGRDRKISIGTRPIQP